LQPSQAPRTSRQDEILKNIELGEGLFSMLTRKAEAHLVAIAATESEQMVELLRSLLSAQVVLDILVRQRQRLSTFQS
jgi:hypothetical protein